MLPSPSIDYVMHVVSRCSDEKSVSCSLQLCAYLQRMELESHASLSNGIISMLAAVGSLCLAQQLYDKLVFRSACTWNSLLSCVLQLGHYLSAFTLYEKMQKHSLNADGPLFVALLGACAQLKFVETGYKLHGDVARLGLLHTNIFVGNKLVDMYVKLNLLGKAREVFDKLFLRDVISWNAIISGYAQCEDGQEALKCLQSMRLDGVSPNAITLTSSLKACSSIKAADRGMELHTEIVKKGLCGGDIILGSSLVDMYARCGLLENAQHVFDKLSYRDVVLWTALISGYAQHEQGEEALHKFEQMEVDGVPPNAITLASSLKACGNVGAPLKGAEIHAEAARLGLLREDLVLGTALLDMYAKCGLLARALDVFDTLSARDIVSWNSLFSGCAQLGQIENVLSMFEKMREGDINADPITFISILNACSHAGLVETGHAYFQLMGKEYAIAPNFEHHLCMLDLLARAGQLDTAIAMVNRAPVHPCKSMWRTVLGACRKWGNVEIGKEAFEQAVQLGDKEAGTYVCMYNVYADAGMQEDAMKVEECAVSNRAWVLPACYESADY